MSRAVKLALYIICVTGIVVFGALTLRAHRSAAQAAERNKERLERLASGESTNAPPATNSPEATATNVPEAVTNVVDATNAPATNATAGTAATNESSATNTATVRKEPGEGSETRAAVAGVSAGGYARMVTYALGLVLFVLGFAALAGYDIAQFFGERAQDVLFSNEGQPADPEYEKAEQLWADGQYLEAVRAMREYLDKNPREQYVALRIAEIYEQNLNNPLAAALEYEEVLKKKLPPERWGWAAIHLVNIYSGKLNKPEQSVALLRRIDAEYGQTSAAKKARERLLQVDPDFVPTSTAETVQAPPEEQPAPRSESNLPPGFRPKGS